MRISQSMLYDNFVSYLNKTTSYLQKLYEMGSSQKKVNRPSDNPVGMSRILNYRDSINSIEQYKKNINTATGWLGLADDTLQQVQDILARIVELTVQASNDSLNEKDRKTIANEIRQLFDQLIALANTTYEDKSLFGGQKLNELPYKKGIAVFSNKRNVIKTQDGTIEELKEEDDLGEDGLEGARVMDPVVPFIESVEGYTDRIVKIQFSKPGSPDDPTATTGFDTINYTYKTLDGEIAGSGVLTPTNLTLDLKELGISINLRKGLKLVVNSETANEERTTLFVAPTAFYNGDDNNKDGIEVISNFNVRVTPVSGSFNSNVWVKIVNSSSVAIGDGNEIEYQYSVDNGVTWSDTLYAENTNSSYAILHLPGGDVKLRWVNSNPLVPQDLRGLQFKIDGIDVKESSTDIHAVAYGDITKDIIVRVDEDVDLTSNSRFTYSYSIDNGRTWITGNLSSTKDSYGYFHLTIPGGVLKLRSAGDNTSISEGSFFTVKPRRADLKSEITNNHFIEINQIGKEIFGGYYKNNSGIEPVFENNEKENLFISIPRLLISLENNDQKGISNTLSYLKEVGEVLAKWQAKVGAKENRINITKDILNNLKINQEERKSYLEDVDFVKLITDISKTQTIYQAILKSASMIMKISLVNYV